MTNRTFTVAALIEALQKEDPEARVVFIGDDEDCTIYDVFACEAEHEQNAVVLGGAA